MSENITAQELIGYFEDRLQETDRGQSDSSVGETPLFPMIIVFLGETSVQGFMQVADHLFLLWPQYRKDISFMCMEKPVSDPESGELVLSELSADGRKLLDQDQMQKMVSGLYSPGNKFRNKQEIKIYYILNTAAIRDINEYQGWADAVARSGGIFGLNDYEVSNMLFLLLDESIGKGEIAGAVKNDLAECYDDEKKLPAKSVFLLSNRRSGNDICGDWQEHYHMIASLIALSNNSNNLQVAASMFSPTVKTVSYAREEKPTEQIGQIIVTGILDYFAENGGTKKQPVEGELLSEQMGITKEGTIEVLDDYAVKKADAMLPASEQLALFPRKDREDTQNFANMQTDEFNERTMNAWGCFLEKKAALLKESLKEKTDSGKSRMEDLLEKYKALITQNFSIGELLYYAENTSVAAKVFEEKPGMPLQAGTVLDAAKNQLRCLLSAEPDIRELFWNLFFAQCKTAKEFQDAWNNLLETRRAVFFKQDATVEDFYEKKLRGYLDKNGIKLAKAFKRLRSREQLLELLKETVDELIADDELYSYSFERELATRLNGGEQQDAANQYIREKLTTEDAHIYLRTGFAWPAPTISVVMLKKGISLHKYLLGSLGEDTYYYDTGISKAAEAIKVYDIPQNKLV